jgi:hypothetical protein
MQSFDFLAVLRLQFTWIVKQSADQNVVRTQTKILAAVFKNV